jgi:hypothetical protein
MTDLRALYKVDPEHALRPLGGIVSSARDYDNDFYYYEPRCEEPWNHMLPLECWERILDYLGPCALLNCASTCQHLCALARADRAWRRHACKVKKLYSFSPLSLSSKRSHERTH